ncbi:MAG: Gfo/Idh/MocA family oxidoreductase, partial [Acidobacteria bacterium]|nr:Gfo/Idh/MocA family oxidoreductase [Acidobacteriota bacterium]
MNRRQFVLAAPTAAMAASAAGANDRIRVAVIGCGGRGLLAEALQFHQECNIQVAAVCDTWRQQREKAAAQAEKASGHAPEQVVHYQDVLAKGGIDAVIISTPDHQHCRQLSAAVRAHKDVYIEKPLAMDMKELNEAVDTVKKSDRVVQVGTQVRSWPASVSGKAFAASGGLGKIFKIEQSRNNFRPYWHGTGARPVQESDVDWKAFLMHRKYRPWNADQYAGWYGYHEFSRGPHTGFMAHFADLVHFVTGASYPLRAVALGGTYRWKDARTAPDSIEVVLEYPEQGFLARYSTTFGTNANNFLKFIGTRGVMDATRWNSPWILSGEGSPEPGHIAPGTEVATVDSTHHMKNWFECLRSRKQPAAPIDAGFGHAVACILADEAFVRG